MPSITSTLFAFLTAATALFAIAIAPLRAQFKPPAPDVEELALGAALQELLKLPDAEKARKLTSLVEKYESSIRDRPLETVSIPGMLIPPNVLLFGPGGWEPASDVFSTAENLFPGNDQQQKKIGEWTMMLGRLLIHFAPEEAFKRMVPRLSDPAPTVLDAVRLISATDRQPGAQLTKPIPKELWLQFYNSPNPCYKILALEKYDSTTQSPEELLKLYRECLFHTFGYLQLRSLDGIFRNKDFRPDVQALIVEFLKTSPVRDDGTLPTFPPGFRNPIDAAEGILSTIENSVPELKGTLLQKTRPLPEVEEKLRKLWQRDASQMPQDEKEQWQNSLRHTEGLSAHLVREIATAWEEQKGETLRPALHALSYRTDLRPDQLRQLNIPLQYMVYEDVDETSEDAIPTLYASLLLRTLRNYPSPEHEALAIAFTESNDDAVRASAAVALGSIGGPLSLAPMKEMMDRIKPTDGTLSPTYQEVYEAFLHLEERVRQIKKVDRLR